MFAPRAIGARVCARARAPAKNSTEGEFLPAPLECVFASDLAAIPAITLHPSVARDALKCGVTFGRRGQSHRHIERGVLQGGALMWGLFCGAPRETRPKAKAAGKTRARSPGGPTGAARALGRGWELPSPAFACSPMEGNGAPDIGFVRK